MEIVVLVSSTYGDKCKKLVDRHGDSGSSKRMKPTTLIYLSPPPKKKKKKKKINKQKQKPQNQKNPVCTLLYSLNQIWGGGVLICLYFLGGDVMLVGSWMFSSAFPTGQLMRMCIQAYTVRRRKIDVHTSWQFEKRVQTEHDRQPNVMTDLLMTSSLVL